MRALVSINVLNKGRVVESVESIVSDAAESLTERIAGKKESILKAKRAELVTETGTLPDDIRVQFNTVVPLFDKVNQDEETAAARKSAARNLAELFDNCSDDSIFDKNTANEKIGIIKALGKNATHKAAQKLRRICESATILEIKLAAIEALGSIS